MSFNFAALISRDIAKRNLKGLASEMVVVHPEVLGWLVQAYHDRVLHCVDRDPNAGWTIDGVALIEDWRVETYEIK